MSDDLAIVGRVRKPHGIHGELVVEPMCDEPGAMFAAGRRLLVSGGNGAPPASEIVVAGSRPFKEGLLLSLHGLTDRTGAEAWRERTFAVPRAELAPADEGEVYVHELLGMRVVHASADGGPNGDTIGTVREVSRVPQGLLLDVDTPRGSVSIPLVDAIVTHVDRDARVITADPPEGLLDL